MTPEKWLHIKAIFNEAVELAPAAREAFLREQNGTGAEILEEVRRLLAAERENRFAEPLVRLPDLLAAETDENFVGKQIGGYKILRTLGSGGMGTVFLAAREDLPKQFAVKVIRHEFSSKNVLRRFETERAILAKLEHPNIAQMLDGGRTETGAPYLVMEYVAGEDLLTYAARRNLSVAARLEIFRRICAAVAYAHGKLVVHRDLKPANILVTASGAPKLLDFGISKLLGEENTEEKGTATALGMMTPNYASPEQFKGESVSTATDVYSLGVILYELLTGALPYAVAGKRFDEAARAVIETEPVAPSAAQRDAETRRRRDTGKNRHVSTDISASPALRVPASQLKGDLDNIILKALRKEPERRYSSVERLSDDLRRHLEGLPVTARPATFSYRLEKFVVRNRVYVMTGLIIFLILIGGIAATSWQAVRAERQRRLAEQRFRQVRELANNVVFKYYDEAEKLSNSTLLREMFVKDSLDYFNNLAADESADDELKIELGKAFLRIARVQGRPGSPNLGQTKNAVENYRKGIEILEPFALASEDVNLQSDLITAFADYAVVLRQNGALAESAVYFNKAVENGEASLARHPENETLALRVVLAIMFRGDSLPVGENENIVAYRKSLAICDRLARKNPDDLRVNVNCAAARERNAFALLALARLARFDENSEAEKRFLTEAETLFRRNVETGEKLVRLYPNQIIAPALLASAQLNYGTILIETEDYQEALEFVQQAEKFQRASLTSDNVSVGQKLEISTIEQKLGAIYLRTGDAVKAAPLYDDAFKLLDFLIEKDAENFDYVKVRAEAKFDYGDELLRRGETEKAREVYEKAYLETLAGARRKDEQYAAALEGPYREKLGSCSLVESSQSKNKILEAIAEYEKAAVVWRRHGALNFSGIEQREKLPILERKIARLKNRARRDD